MIRTVVEGHLEVDTGKPGQYTLGGGFEDSFFNRRDVRTRNRTADNGVHKFKSGAPRLRLELNPAIAELAVSAGLLLMPALNPNLFLYGFPVWHLGDVEHGFDIEFSLQLFDRDFDVDLAGAGEQNFLRFGVAVELQTHVFFHQFGERTEDLVFIPLGFGGQGVGDQGGYRFRRGKLDLSVFGTQRVAGGGFLEFSDRHNGPRPGFAGWFLLFAGQGQELVVPLPGPLVGVVKCPVAGKGAGDDAEDR